MPLGSSSEAPAMSPGPSTRLRRDLVLAQLWPAARFFRLLGVAVTTIGLCLVGTSKDRGSAGNETRPINPSANSPAGAKFQCRAQDESGKNNGPRGGCRRGPAAPFLTRGFDSRLPSEMMCAELGNYALTIAP